MDSLDNTKSNSTSSDSKKDQLQRNLEEEYSNLHPLQKQPTMQQGIIMDMPLNLGTTETIAKKQLETGIDKEGTLADLQLNESMEGYLQKYSPSMLKGWQKRYVILKDRRLYYKKKQQQPYPNGVVNFDRF